MGSVIILIVGLKEDILGNVSPITRLITILVASLIFISNLDSYPILNFNLFNDVYEYKLFKIIFYVLAISALANGVNMIDGMNGLASFSVISMLSSIVLLSFIFEEYELIKTSIYIILAIIGFMVFNFPKGLIFMGDTGAYWLGWVTGLLIIKLFSINGNISTWCVVLITSYPIIEVLFSAIRKIINGYSPFEADHKHIHIKLFFAISKNKDNSNLLNGLVTICLMPLWFIPLSLVAWIDKFPILVLFSILLQISIYLIYYFILPDPDKKEYLKLFNKYKLK